MLVVNSIYLLNSSMTYCIMYYMYNAQMHTRGVRTLYLQSTHPIRNTILYMIKYEEKHSESLFQMCRND